MLLFVQSSLCCLFYCRLLKPSFYLLFVYVGAPVLVHHSSPQMLVLLFLLKSVFPFLFGTHPKCSVHVFSDFPSFLCFCLFSPPALQKMVRKVRGSCQISLLFCCLPPMPVVFDHNVLQLPLLPVCGLILPFLPALLSGVFQTSGPYQEPPGLALLSPLLLPICTGTPSFISSQQQLQEDKIATGCPAASQTVGLTSI